MLLDAAEQRFRGLGGLEISFCGIIEYLRALGGCRCGTQKVKDYCSVLFPSTLVLVCIPIYHHYLFSADSQGVLNEAS
jgi:hypothetical protein